MLVDMPEPRKVVPIGKKLRFGRLIGAITSAFLLARSVLGLLAGFLAETAFCGLGLLRRLAHRLWMFCFSRLRAVLGWNRVITGFSLPGCGRHIDHSSGEKLQIDVRSASQNRLGFFIDLTKASECLMGKLKIRATLTV